jgi:hypothetical protein
MENEHVLSGLIRKRAELSGQFEHTQNLLRTLVIDLDNIDAAILIFDPDIKLDEIRPRPLPPRHPAFKGEVSRAVFSALRNSNVPMTAPELAQHLMAERGLDTSNKKLVRLMGKRVAACLRHHRKRGIVVSDGDAGKFLVWWLA